jgi:RNA polymerase primary sigma factor
VAKAEDTFDVYLREINVYTLLTADEEKELADRIKEGDEEARDRMIRCNLRLVVHVAKKYSRRGLHIMDLIEEGNIGLLKAVGHFDSSFGTRFSTYAIWWIKQAIRRSLINTTKTVRIPAYMEELIAKWKAAFQELTSEIGAEPTPLEIAERLNISKEKLKLIKRILSAQGTTSSLSNEDFGSITEVLKDESMSTPEDILFNREELQRMNDLLAVIDERESKILKLRYGLDSGEPLTLEKIGQRLGLTRERVRQIENEALERLHRIMASSE